MLHEKKCFKCELSSGNDGTKKKNAADYQNIVPYNEEDNEEGAINHLLAHLQSYLNYGPAFQTTILPMLKVRTLEKTESVVEQGGICKTAFWLQSGYGRYFAEEKDKEGLPVNVTIDFFRHGRILVIAECFFNDIPSRFNVELAAGSVVIDFPKHFFDTLKLTAPEAETLATKILAMDRQESQEKMNMVKMKTRDRYQEFLGIYGAGIEQYFAIKHIASYLGMRPSYLSRIRSEHLKKISG